MTFGEDNAVWKETLHGDKWSGFCPRKGKVVSLIQWMNIKGLNLYRNLGEKDSRTYIGHRTSKEFHAHCGWMK